MVTMVAGTFISCFGSVPSSNADIALDFTMENIAIHHKRYCGMQHKRKFPFEKKSNYNSLRSLWAKK